MRQYACFIQELCTGFFAASDAIKNLESACQELCQFAGTQPGASHAIGAAALVTGIEYRVQTYSADVIPVQLEACQCYLDNVVTEKVMAIRKKPDKGKLN